jgi:hypothetical protein
MPLGGVIPIALNFSLSVMGKTTEHQRDHSAQAAWSPQDQARVNKWFDAYWS